MNILFTNYFELLKILLNILYEIILYKIILCEKSYYIKNYIILKKLY